MSESRQEWVLADLGIADRRRRSRCRSIRRSRRRRRLHPAGLRRPRRLRLRSRRRPRRCWRSGTCCRRWSSSSCSPTKCRRAAVRGRPHGAAARRSSPAPRSSRAAAIDWRPTRRSGPLRGRHRRGRRRRPLDDHLHVGHDGRAQGRDADARQHPLERRRPSIPVLELNARRRRAQVPAAEPLVRADGHLPLPVRRASPSSSPRTWTRWRATCSRRADGDDRSCRACARSCRRACTTPSQRRRRRGAGCSNGLARVGSARPRRAGAGADALAPFGLSRSGSATGWCSPRSARGSAGGCACSCPAARRCRAHIGEFFHAAGVPLIEGYGLTETAPVMTANPPGRRGSAASAGDRRRRAAHRRGRRDPRARPERDAGLLEPAGRHRRRCCATAGSTPATSARSSDDGFLTITDRKKELLVTSGGKKIAPQPIEARLKRHPLVAEAMVVGDRRRFPAVLIVPEFDVLGERLKVAGPAGGLARGAGRRGPTSLGLYQRDRRGAQPRPGAVRAGRSRSPCCRPSSRSRAGN